jgi:hypothetical protein
MNGGPIKNLIYLLFIATIFYFIVGKIFKVVKFNKLTQLSKGIYFSTFILLFYFFYKVIPVLLFRNSNITEGMSLADSLMSGGKSSETGSSGNSGTSIDYTKGWDNADNFRDNYCSKTPIFVERNFFDDRSKETGNPQGGLIYGGNSQLYDSTTKEMNKKFAEELIKQMNIGNKVDTTSFTKENGCSTNLLTDKGGTGTMSQMCNPKCNFKFTGASK